VRIGTPTAAVGILFSVVYLLISKLTESFGAPALAALGIVNRLESVNYLTSAAMGMGVAAMVGQNLGARQPDRAERVADRGAALITLTTGVVGGLYLLVPEFFVRLFTEDPAAIAESVNFLRIVAISQIFMGWELVYGQAFTGAGDTLPPMHISVWMSVLRVPLAWWFADHTSGGLDGVWWVISLTCILRGILVAGWFRVGRWKTRDARFIPLPPAALVPGHGPEGPDG
ncbi:MAG: hypothetical protein KC591_00745, partial [Gemmatimonadetes bacterium]|nr:hypothetical protein [Gemmatimonadota bacterium]